MATIRIVRNDAGNCINFFGSSNPTYWNACLSGQVDRDDEDSVNVINDIITSQTGEVQYEFFRIPYTEFVDADGNSFSSPTECAEYITEKANVVGLGSEGIDLVGEAICFKLDATSTSIMLDNGYSFGVNTIKAVPHPDGTIHIISNDDSSSVTHFYNLDALNVCVNGEPVSGGLQDVSNTLNELFTVGAFESVVITDPYSTIIANVSGETAGYILTGSTVINPVGDDLATNSTNGNYAGVLSIATINQAGEYFTFDIRGEGEIGFGLVHTNSSYDSIFYNGNSEYANPDTFASGNTLHHGFQFSHFFHPTQDGSWSNYGANSSSTQRPGWSSFPTSAEGTDWVDGENVKIRVGIDANGYISIETLRSGTTWSPHVRTSYVVQEGSEYKLGIKFSDSLARLSSPPKVHTIDSAQPPVDLGTDAITVFGEGISGTLAGGIISSATDGFDNDGFVTTQTIDSIGEYFEFTWSSGGDVNFGLFSENDHDVSDLTSDTTVWSNDDYIFYGARAEDNGVMTTVYSEGNLAFTSVGSSNDSSVSQYYGRVGFDGQGRPTVWYSVDGVTYTVFHHAQASAPSGDYKFIWIAQESGAV
ncbi:MAG: hypothetical protein P8J32_01315, partial [bacterium]|nr:hypothetical protein [bacterium]